MKQIFWILIFLLGPVVYLPAQVFDFVVSKDGSGTHTSVQAAVNDCPDQERKLIFVKKGVYEEKVMIGSHSRSSTQLISLIGEDPGTTVITWDDHNGKSIVYDGRTVTSGTPQSATFTVNAADFYAENITFKNSWNSNQAVALYNVGDRQTFKNCRLTGYQDTHYTKKACRSYYYACEITGGTDYICAGGTCIFDSCLIRSLRNGSYITAPEDITAYATAGNKRYYYGFIFRNCRLTSEPGVVVYLGRPWQATSSSVYLNCEMENIKPEGWSTWSGNNHLSSFFAEYNSTDVNSNPLDVSKRVDWSYQLSKEEVDTYYTNDRIYSSGSGAYDPFSLVVAPETPQNLRIENEQILWDPVQNAKGYILMRDQEAVALTTEIAHAYAGLLKNAGDAVFTVRAVGANGNLSLVSEEIKTGGAGMSDRPEVSAGEVYFHDPVLYVPENEKAELFSMAGILLKTSHNQRQMDLSAFQPGNYVLKLTRNEVIRTIKIRL